jgi:hypothetical protein
MKKWFNEWNGGVLLFNDHFSQSCNSGTPTGSSRHNSHDSPIERTSIYLVTKIPYAKKRFFSRVVLFHLDTRVNNAWTRNII